MIGKRILLATALIGLTLLPLASLDLVWAGDLPENPKYNLVYVPTDDEVIAKMFEMAKVAQSDTVFDLGCGDGRVVCQAIKKFGCKGVGIDLNPLRIKECMETIEKFKLGEKVQNFELEFRLGDAIKVPDLERANVIFLYMLPNFMDMLEPIALKTLKPGSRIVSHDYRWETTEWEPDISLTFQGPSRSHQLYLWTVPDKKAAPKTKTTESKTTK